MLKWLSSLLAALVLTGLMATVEPAQAQVSIRIGPPPSPYHHWVPERRVWRGRRHVRVPGRWERRAYRRDDRRHDRQYGRQYDQRDRSRERR
jgi:hypothetical protein